MLFEHFKQDGGKGDRKEAEEEEGGEEEIEARR